MVPFSHLFIVTVNCMLFVPDVVSTLTIFGGNLSPFTASPITTLPSGITITSTTYPSFVVT